MRSDAARYAIFYSAAAFNALVGIGFVLFPDLVVAQMTGVETPANRAITTLFGMTVIVFGLGYAWAAGNFEANKPIIKLALIGKAAAFFTVVALTLGEQTSLSALGGASVDLIYAILFAKTLGWV